MNRVFVCVVSACVALAVTRASGAEVNCGAMRAVFGPRGELERFVSAKGIDFLETRLARPEPLWQIRLCRPDDFTKTVDVSASAAKEVSVERDGDGLVITYRDAGAVREAKVTVRPDAADGKLRWRIAATPAEGWALYRTDFPRLRLTDSIGATGADDAVLAGLGHAGVLRNPSAPRWDRSKSMPERAAAWARHSIFARQPGPLAAQFFTFWDTTSGFYTACEDGKGYAKELQFTKNYADGGFSFAWQRFTYSEKPDAQDYDVVTSAFGGDAMNPVDWRDAADLYKKWALTQHWCRMPLKYRTDLPAWTKDAPAMLAFYTEWIERPELIERFFADYWTKEFPGVPTAASLVGWEKHGEWIGIDYFPMYPSDEITSNTFRGIKKYGSHPWPWPSGHHWSTLRKPRGDGTFQLDQTKEFEELGGPKMVCVNPDGSLYADRRSSWLAGGNRYCLCPGDAKVRDFWTKNVCVELVKRGAEMIQSDQDTGAHVPECWSRDHGHAPGEGLWKTADMYRQFEETVAECRKIEPGFIITFEEPNEHFNDLLFIQDHRNCRFNLNGKYDWEWADVFGYLYHEFVAPFQSDVVNGNSFWWTHAAVEGHVPYAAHLVPSDCFDGMPVVANGDFERTTQKGTRMTGWDGPANQHIVKSDRDGGGLCLRLEKRQGKTPLVAQSFGKDTAFMKPGTKLRLGAWLKAEKVAKGDNLRLLCLDSNLKNYATVNLEFPKTGTGWQRVSADFTVPKGATVLRLLCFVLGDTVAWVDDVTLETVDADGKATLATARSRVAYMKFLKQWVNLYHGPGRDWLAHGRHVRPPRYVCDKVPYDFSFRGEGHAVADMPSVFCAAYESLDGAKAVVFGNATYVPRPVAYFEDGAWKKLTLKPAELRLVTPYLTNK